jgi:hypothetical protein
VLEGRYCGEQVSPGVCGGYDLTYYALCPGRCDGKCGGQEAAGVCDDSCRVKWERNLYSVSMSVGPEVIQKHCVNGGGGFFAEVQFTLVAGNPFQYGPPKSAQAYPFAFTYQTARDTFDPTYQNWLDELGGDPNGEYANLWPYLWDLIAPTPVSIPPAPAPPAPGTPRATSGPGLPGYRPPLIVDPDCPVPPSFPTPPQDLWCGSIWNGSWVRSTYRMQGIDVAFWDEQLPILSVTDTTRDHNDIRVRFTPDGFNPDGEHAAEFYITYLPQNATMRLNGPRDSIVVERGYGPERADQLVVVNSNGQPMRWPVVTCGGSWIITVDVPTGASPETIKVDLDLVARVP